MKKLLLLNITLFFALNSSFLTAMKPWYEQEDIDVSKTYYEPQESMGSAGMWEKDYFDYLGEEEEEFKGVPVDKSYYEEEEFKGVSVSKPYLEEKDEDDDFFQQYRPK